MVLQRAPEQARVFGVVTPNEVLMLVMTTTTVPGGASWQHRQRVQANADGQWNALLPAREASSKTTYNITIASTMASGNTATETQLATASSSQTLSDVLFGDVIICSGR